MKNLFSILLVICIFISCCACGNNNTNVPTENETETNTQIDSNKDVNNDYSTNNSVIEESNKPTTNENSTISSNSTTSNKPSANSTSSNTSKPSSNNNGSTASTKPSTSENSSTQSTPAHTHNYSNATCTQAATCSCGATKGSKLGHKFSGESCTRCGEKNPNYIKTYGLGEKWIVDGEWEFTVNSVTTHSLCNSLWNKQEGLTNEQVVIVDFTYKNIGYTAGNGLLHFALFNAYDETGVGGEGYACTHENPCKQCPVGTASKSQEAYVLLTKSNEITFMVQNLDNSRQMQKATFKVPVS